MKEIIRLCFVLTIIAAVSAGVLAYVNEKTAEPIAKALLEEKMSAVRSVLPPYDNEPDKDMITIGLADGDSLEVYRGQKDGAVTGAAFAITSPDGYSGDIEFMIGVDGEGVMQGLMVLNHLETPGLGAKIQNEDFRGQYKGKSLENPELWEVTKDGGNFIAITGATISSRAITRAAARGLKLFRVYKAEIFGEAADIGS
ncbi:MAG: RnfABCDGE type electron transport complex subunit G, partial [Candidatus Krumholzibacteria bacterium]|nr:RnfABCDGE type electron transport complex subunit G [Candidatus Krumholzibacteria bacterium]